MLEVWVAYDLQGRGGRKQLVLDAAKEVTGNGLMTSLPSTSTSGQFIGVGHRAEHLALPSSSEVDSLTVFRETTVQAASTVVSVQLRTKAEWLSLLGAQLRGDREQERWQLG